MKTTQNYMYLAGLWLTITLGSCVSTTNAQQKTKGMSATDVTEASYIQPLASSSTNDNCSNCEKKPGDLPQFTDVLKDSKLQRYSSGGINKVEYKKAETFCDPTFFYTCGEQMVLISPDQEKDRLELRQEKDLSLNSGAIMRLQAKFENLPNGNSKKGVTLAQIHSDADEVGRPLLRLEYTGADEISVVVTDTYEKGEGKSLNDFLVAFKDGQTIYSKIEIEPTGHKVNVYVKNLDTGKSNFKTYTVSTTWLQKDGDFYFKTGAYLQESGKSPKVTYSLLNFYY